MIVIPPGIHIKMNTDQMAEDKYGSMDDNKSPNAHIKRPFEKNICPAQNKPNLIKYHNQNNCAPPKNGTSKDMKQFTQATDSSWT